MNETKEKIASIFIPLYGGHETQGTIDLSDEVQQEALLWARIKADQILNLVRQEIIKEVVKWGSQECYDHNIRQREDMGWGLKRRECALCWQELKEGKL